MFGRPPRPVARMASFPSPTRGWNARDSLSDMKQGFAPQLDNFFPSATKCSLRPGYESFCNIGVVQPVKSLMEWTGTSEKLLAACNGNIYDITSGTASSVGSGFTSDVWESVQFRTAAGSYTIMANGVDTEQKYDGTTLSAVGNTGPTNKVHSPCSFAGRMFYAEVATLKVWYSTAGAFAGTPLTAFDVGSICQFGGEIAALATWTKQNATLGSNELFVIVTTKGEVLVYQGTDPAVAANWAIVGRFAVGEPVSGHRSVLRSGSELILICADGYQPLSRYLPLGRAQADTTGFSDYIVPAATSAVRETGGTFGWSSIVWPEGDHTIVNVPTATSGVYDQHVVNHVTSAWCRYTNIPALCWATFDSGLYFGDAGGKIWRFGRAIADNGADIVGEMVTAFELIGRNGFQKRFTMCRPRLATSTALTYSLGLNRDYVLSDVLSTINSNPTSASLWGTAIWGTSLWGGGQPVQQLNWTGVSGLGFAAAPHLKVSTHTVEVEVNGFDLLYEQGGVV